jgi:hypothetical protein
LCESLTDKRDIETSSRLIPLVDDLTHILIEAGKNKLQWCDYGGAIERLPNRAPGWNPKARPPLRFIEPMYARLVNELPEGREWLVAEIEFTEWTPEGHLRHSKFFSVREDKDPRTVVRELGSGQ